MRHRYDIWNSYRRRKDNKKGRLRDDRARSSQQQRSRYGIIFLSRRLLFFGNPYRNNARKNLRAYGCWTLQKRSYKSDDGKTSGTYSGTAPEAASNEKAVYIGTNVEYAPYVELGTGKYADGGRKDSWVYQDTEGKWHHTNGQKAQPYLKPAVADHKQTYRNIIEDALKNA